jgi:hypothetical protein
MKQISIGREKAIELAESDWWEKCTARQIVEFQLFVAELCMPFEKLHEALEEALGRSVWIHELASDNIINEFLGKRKKPTMEEIINLIPEEKRIILIKD